MGYLNKRENMPAVPGTNMRGYTAADVAKIGVKRELLKDWIDRGFIEPGIYRAEGPGTRNIFDHYDLYKIKLFKYLIHRGFAREDAAKRADFIVNSYKFYERQKDKPADDLPLETDKWVEKVMESDFILLSSRGTGTANFPWIQRIANRNGTFDEPIGFVGIGYDAQGNLVQNFIDRTVPFDLKYFRDHDDLLILNFRKLRNTVDHEINT